MKMDINSHLVYKISTVQVKASADSQVKLRLRLANMYLIKFEVTNYFMHIGFAARSNN